MGRHAKGAESQNVLLRYKMQSAESQNVLLIDARLVEPDTKLHLGVPEVSRSRSEAVLQ